MMEVIYKSLWLVPALPALGFLTLAFFGRRMTQREVSFVGVGSVGGSALVSLLLALGFDAPFTQKLWTWIHVGSFQIDFAFILDPLSLVMILIVTCIGFLIHLYATGYMKHDASYARFFAYMNLFVAAMLVLVLADNLLLLFLGWEGVGLCSFLLIGFWYQEEKNILAATKAFLVTRIGDVFLLVGLLVLALFFKTLNIHDLPVKGWHPGLSIVVALLLLGGAVGKSGQVPLHVWLPDAMAGPTPVSALIHAATMVTAGVYLIARMHVVFDLAPLVQFVVACIGAVTLLIAGISALAQRDIKRVLAYSTISQIGYMFLALGVGAYSAAIFHLFTHAIFKALLFMAAGAVITAMHHEQDMFKMGGLRKRLPVVFWTFLIGAMSLSALPLVSAGFFSKDLILYDVWASERGGVALWSAGVVGAFFTSLYTFRMVFITFFGEERGHVHEQPGRVMTVPLIFLAFGATVCGFVELPHFLADLHLFTHFLEHVLPPAPIDHGDLGIDLMLFFIAEAVVLLGVLTAWFIWGRRSQDIARSEASSEMVMAHGPKAALKSFAASGLGFDWLYVLLFVRSFKRVSIRNRTDIVDTLISGGTRFTHATGRVVLQLQSSRLRWYMAWMAIGTILAVSVVVYS